MSSVPNPFSALPSASLLLSPLHFIITIIIIIIIIIIIMMMMKKSTLLLHTILISL